MQGKRSWFAVRSALVEAIESKETKSASLKIFFTSLKCLMKQSAMTLPVDAFAHCPNYGDWQERQEVDAAGGELDRISPATYDSLLKLNTSRFPLVMGAGLNKNFEKVFQSTINFGSTYQLSFDRHRYLCHRRQGHSTVEEMCVMLTTPEWLPVDNIIEQQLIGRLLQRSAAFRNSFATISLR